MRLKAGHQQEFGQLKIIGPSIGYRKPVWLGVVIAFGMLAMSCGSDSSSPSSGVDDVGGRNTEPVVNEASIGKVVQATNAFAAEFFKANSSPDENVVIGNYSLSTVLLLTMAGTAGDTTTAFGELLGVQDVESDELHTAVNSIDLLFESRTGDGVELFTANSLFARQGLEFKDGFLNTAASSYSAPVQMVDFKAKETVDVVNQWVDDQTNGFIDRIVDSFSPETVLVLANAIYLKALWDIAFERIEALEAFTLADGTTVETDYMRRSGYIPHNRSDDFVAVELPYKGGELGLVIIQPDDLAVFEQELSGTYLADIVSGLRETDIDFLKVPIWAAKTELNALESLHGLGLPQTYDFSAMIDMDALRPGTEITIGDILHVARIEVDEEGTTAAAASAAVAVAESESIHVPYEVHIESPFFYFIRDRASNAILFMGHVVDPTRTS